MARLENNAGHEDIFNAVADGIARMSSVAFNLCAQNGKASNYLTGWDGRRVHECAKKAHQLSTLLGKLMGDTEYSDARAIIEFNRINP